VLATRLNNLLTLTFQRSAGFRNIVSQILYLSQAKTGQWRTMCTLSSLSYPHSRYSCRSVCPSLYKWALRVTWSVNSPTAALKSQSIHCQELISCTRQRVSHQRFRLSAASTGSPPGLMFPVQMLLNEFSFAYTKGYSSKLVRWDFSMTFLGQSTHLLIAWYPLMLRYPHWSGPCWVHLVFPALAYIHKAGMIRYYVS
jgi:hypothetical protein